ncbi:MAG: hypothetical protein ABGY75_04535 [Gemmataceae bacterium]
MDAKMDNLVDAVTADDRFPVLDESADEWMQITAADMLPALAEVAGAGLTYYPPGVVVGETPQTDAAYAAAAPNGTTRHYLVLRSWRPESLPDYGYLMTATDNPGSVVDNVTFAQGWNLARVASLPMMWRATECYYQPGGVKVLEDHVAEGGWPQNDYWTSNAPRRAISVEVFEQPGGGFGNLVNIGCDTDSFHLQSVARRTVAEGGQGGPRGSYFRVNQSISDGSADMILQSVATGQENYLRMQMHPAGYVMMYSASKPVYIRALDGAGGYHPLFLNADTRFEGPFRPASSADADAPNGSVYYSTTQNKLVFKDPGGTVNPLH